MFWLLATCIVDENLVEKRSEADTKAFNLDAFLWDRIISASRANFSMLI